MWPGKPLEFVKVANDQEGVHFGLYQRNKLVSVVSCFEQHAEMQFRKLATLPESQKQGFGSHLLSYILDIASKKGMQRVWCNARVNKKSFYEKFGLEDTKEHFTKEGIAYTIMELRISQ